MYTINPTCPLCGLRYADRPLLDLHIREDHVQRQQAPEPGPGEPGDTGPPRQTPPPVAPLSRAASSRQAPQSALNRVVGALRRFHQETMLASALVVFRGPPPRPQATMPAANAASAANAVPAGERRPAANEAPARGGTIAASAAEHAHRAA
jgi:hypothetical protein